MENEGIVFIDTRIILPVTMHWKPKEDITTYELALCLSYFNRTSVMPYEIDYSQPHMRHFEIIDPNKN